MTLKVRDDVPLLRSQKLVHELDDAFARAGEYADYRLVHWALERGQAHFLIEAKGRRALGNCMRSVAARFSRAVNRVFERKGQVLGDRYRYKVLRTFEEVQAAVRRVPGDDSRFSSRTPLADPQLALLRKSLGKPLLRSQPRASSSVARSPRRR